MNKNYKIYIAGHKGMVGSAIWRALESKGYTNLIGRTSKELDLRNQQQVQAFFQTEKPDVVIDAAARVGGILANNNYPYTFLMENMQIQNNLIQTALDTDVQKFVFLGSSCIYPKLAPQPLQEECLLTSSLEPTNEWYAIAKISGVKACESIRKQFNKDFVSTQTGSFILNTTILRPQPKKTYNKIEYAANADNERIPDFRTPRRKSTIALRLSCLYGTFFYSATLVCTDEQEYSKRIKKHI